MWTRPCYIGQPGDGGDKYSSKPGRQQLQGHQFVRGVVVFSVGFFPLRSDSEWNVELTYGLGLVSSFMADFYFLSPQDVENVLTADN